MQVRTCCCSFPLKTGCIAIGTLYLIFYVPALLAVIFIGLDEKRRGEMFKSESVEELGTEQKKTAYNMAYGLVITVLVCSICLNIALILASIYTKAVVLYVWFVVHIFAILIMAATVVVNSFSRIADVKRRAGTLFSTIVDLFVTLYFLIVVHSYYEELRAQKFREYLQHLRLERQVQQQQLHHQYYNQGQQQQHQPNIFTISSSVSPETSSYRQ